MSDFFSGQSGTQTVNQTVDPSQQRLNDLYFGEALNLRNTTGGAGAFGGPQPGLFSLGPTENAFRNQTIAATSDPGLYPQIRSWAGSDPAGPIDTEAINSLRALLGRSLQGPSDLEQGSLDTYGSRLDPNQMLQAAARYMEMIGGPQAKAASVAGGMGGLRGGAFQEALSRRSAELAMPILQMLNQNVGEYGGAQQNVSNQLEGRRGGLSRDLFGMGSALDARTAQRAQMMPGIDQAEMARLTAGQQAAAMPRLLALQDFLRQQDVTMSTLLKTPVKTGEITTTQKNEDLNLGSLIGPAAIAAAGYLSRN